MKRVKNRKTILVSSFASISIIALLLSSMIGTTVGKKPSNTGKPVERWDLKIRIGIGELNGIGNLEDIVLISSDHEDQDGFYLFAEDVPCSGGLWNLPSEKGPPRERGWAFGAIDLGWTGEDRGTYYLAHVLDPNTDPPVYLDDFYEPTDPTVAFSIQHQISPPREGYPLEEDYWTFHLAWLDSPDSTPEEGTMIFAQIQTDNGPEAEGTLSETMGWLVEFIGAEATLYCYEYPPVDETPPLAIWEGSVSFTVGITRSPHAP